MRVLPVEESARDESAWEEESARDESATVGGEC